ncbi:unnamed protein product [Aureobasidium pullulans]|nr:unnamed protein product [Aureobasidium pullulans]
MSLSCQRVLRRCATVQSPVRASLSSTRSKQFLSRRWQSTDAEAAAPTNPKIAAIVDQIGQLTLLETADLVSSLKEEAAPAAQEKTLFNLKLQSFDAGSKPKVIKEIKSLLGLSLVDSKKFVESAPKLMKEGVPKEEGEKIVETLKALGAVVVME